MKIFQTLKFSKNKLIIFSILFLFFTLTPLVKSDVSIFTFTRAQPAVIYLYLLTDYIDTHVSDSSISILLYFFVYLSGYFIIYFISCIIAESFALFAKKTNDKKTG